MEILYRYFEEFTAEQEDRFKQLGELYREWNAQINVISRKDIDNLYTHHVLHSMALAALIEFQPGAKILDLGTGGGFPGIPLAILFPDTEFVLVDSIAKKIKVVDAVKEALELDNVRAAVTRAEKLKEKFDFVVTRAVAKAPKLVSWTRRLVSKQEKHSMPNGLWAYKGLTNIKAEVAELNKNIFHEIYPLSDIFEEPFFESKCLLYLQY